MWLELVLLVIVLSIGYIFFKLVKNTIYLAVNSVVGIFALIGFNTLFGTSVAVNIWSVLITAIGGVFGFILVLAGHYLGLAF